MFAMCASLRRGCDANGTRHTVASGAVRPVRVTPPVDDATMDLRTTQIVATAVFDERVEQVVVAGQVLRGRAGVDGLALTVTLADRSLATTTGPHGSFGVRFEAMKNVAGRQAIVQIGRLRTTCAVR